MISPVFPISGGLRFDPLEAYFCEVEMLSLESDKGPLAYSAKAAVNVDGWDRFLTTDPQYYINVSSQEQSVTVVFRLRLLSHSEAEDNLYGFLDRQNRIIETFTGRLQEKEADLRGQMEIVREQNGKIERTTARIQEQNEQLIQYAGYIQEQREEIERKSRKLQQQDKN